MEEVGSTGDRQDRVYRHGAYDSDDDEMGDFKYSDKESESDESDGGEEGGRAMFRSNGQKINVDTSGLSSGVEDSGDGSRGEDDGGWGQ